MVHPLGVTGAGSTDPGPFYFFVAYRCCPWSLVSQLISGGKLIPGFRRPAPGFDGRTDGGIGFLGFWVKNKKTPDLAPPSPPFAANHTPGPSAGARARFFAAQNPGKLLATIKFAVALLRCRTRGLFFSAGDARADRAGPLPWDKHLVLPGAVAQGLPYGCCL